MTRKQFQRYETICRTLDGSMTVKEAADILNLSTRQIQRLKKEVDAKGPAALIRPCVHYLILTAYNRRKKGAATNPIAAAAADPRQELLFKLMLLLLPGLRATVKDMHYMAQLMMLPDKSLRCL